MVFGGGLIGLPVACSDNPEGGSGTGFDAGTGLEGMSAADREQLADLLTPEYLAGLPELTDEEAARFVEDIDARALDMVFDGEDVGKPKVPPGQHVVETMPVMASNPSPRDLEAWRFKVSGEVNQELEFTWEEFKKLPRVEIVADVHCVTSWSALDIPWGGVKVSHLLALAGVTGKGNFVIFDCEQGYTTNIDIAEAMKDNVLIADKLYGQPLSAEYGGPARGLVPDRYYYKSGKWVTGIRVLAEDEPGYWETRGYSNTAYPWEEDRYS